MPRGGKKSKGKGKKPAHLSKEEERQLRCTASMSTDRYNKRHEANLKIRQEKKDQQLVIDIQEAMKRKEDAKKRTKHEARIYNERLNKLPIWCRTPDIPHPKHSGTIKCVPATAGLIIPLNQMI